MITLKHKWFVAIAGVKLGVSLKRILLHDLSKFTRAELPGYGRRFFGDGDKTEFDQAWAHHTKHNRHHPENWRVTMDGRDMFLQASEMSNREMVADWLAASRAYEGQWPTKGNWQWYEKNFEKIGLHPKTRKLSVELLDRYFSNEVENEFR